MVTSAAYAPNRTEARASDINKSSGFTFIGDGYYRKLPIQTKHPILLNILQDRNYARIKEKEIDNALTVKRLIGDRLVPLDTVKFKASIKIRHGTIPLKLQKFQTEGKTVVIPDNMDDFPAQFAISPDGRKSLIASDDGLWLAIPADNRLKRISAGSYKGKSYEELEKKSIEAHGKNLVAWNADAMFSPDGTKIVYKSNKNNVGVRGAALFAYDLASGTETVIGDTAEADYMVLGWVTPETMVCQKFSIAGISVVLIDLNGKETKLRLAGEKPAIYAVQNEFIAYATELSGGDIHIAKANAAGTVQEISTVKMRGTIRLRGNNGFSPDHSYFAFIYVPDKKQTQRYLKVVDLQSNTVTDIDSLPDRVRSSARYLDFEWADADRLLITLQEETAGRKMTSTWSYSL